MHAHLAAGGALLCAVLQAAQAGVQRGRVAVLQRQVRQQLRHVAYDVPSSLYASSCTAVVTPCAANPQLHHHGYAS